MNKLQKIILDYVVFFPMFYFVIPSLSSCFYFIYLCCHDNVMLPSVIKILFILIDLFCMFVLLSYFHRAVKENYEKGD
ncbi:MAG: hypothetical protein KAW56_05770, partial [Candidatus Marinimicrobia bacterium]|nr:hypothetical protein [Candidatus Neomarinimicrobiota bacterium]